VLFWCCACVYGLVFHRMHLLSRLEESGVSTAGVYALRLLWWLIEDVTQAHWLFTHRPKWLTSAFCSGVSGQCAPINRPVSVSVSVSVPVTCSATLV